MSEQEPIPALLLTAEQILGMEDLDILYFDVPKWGRVAIRQLSGQKREELERLIQLFNAGTTTKQSVRAFAAVNSLCNDAKKLLFNEKQIDALAGKCSVALDVVFDQVLTFNTVDRKF